MGERKTKIKDLVAAGKDEVVAAVIESDAFPELIKDIADVALSEGTATMIGGVMGALAPRLNGVFLSYKENRFERNVLKTIELMNSRIVEIDKKLSALSEQVRERFQNEYSGWFLNNIYEEKQESKIKYHVDGFIGMMEESVSEDTMLMFMDTLNQLTTLDIRVLSLYCFQNDDTILDVMREFNVDDGELNVSKEKLARFGLLERKNDIQRDNNIDMVVEYLVKLNKESKKKNPTTVRLPSIKKIPHSESYKITTLGNTFLKRLGITRR